MPLLTLISPVRLRARAFPAFLLPALLLAAAPAGVRTDPPSETAAFTEHLDLLVPRLLAKSGVPGAAVGLVRGGEVVFVQGWGSARLETGTPVRPETLFNVGSIAKPVAAWGVMKLVEQGKVDLDAPVSRYVSDWSPATGSFDPDGITVRRLHSHTAGLSMPSVPSLEASRPTPSVAAALEDAGAAITLATEPGTEWSYSGGGFMVLQLLIEEVSGRPFAEYMREEVLEPLGLHRTTFEHPENGPRRGLAKPYHDGSPAPLLQWPGAAAAGLYTTPLELARFVAASLPDSGTGESRDSATGTATVPRTRGAVVLSPASIRLMRTPAPGTTRPYTTRYGLGHDLWPLPDGGFAAGHNGQNTGWSAAAWWLPDTGDGIVILTNDSHGMAVHRWVLCDWIDWVAGRGFGGYCVGRDAQPAGKASWSSAGVASAKREQPWWRGLVAAGEPGGALVVRRWGGEVLSETRGVADLATGREIDPETPFYIASVAKPMTAGVLRRLEERGLLEVADPVGPLFPELPTLASVTLRHLLDQTAGVPDYFQWIQWSRFRSLDDQGVIDTLAAHPGLTDEPGRRFAYSNSHYVLLSEAIRRATGVPLRTLLMEEYAAPLGLESLHVDDGAEPLPPVAARGYQPEDGEFRLSSYEELDLPGSAPIVPLQWATTGAGGVFASAEDLARWGERVAGSLPDAPAGATLFAEHSGPGIGTVIAYRRGWYISRLESRTIFWHAGNKGGYGALLAVVPDEGLTVGFVANRSDLEPEAIVEREIRRRLVGE